MCCVVSPLTLRNQSVNKQTTLGLIFRGRGCVTKTLGIESIPRGGDNPVTSHFTSLPYPSHKIFTPNRFASKVILKLPTSSFKMSIIECFLEIEWRRTYSKSSSFYLTIFKFSRLDSNGCLHHKQFRAIPCRIGWPDWRVKFNSTCTSSSVIV